MHCSESSALNDCCTITNYTCLSKCWLILFSSLYIRKSRSGILRLIVHSNDMWAGALWKLIPRTWDEENPPQWQHFPRHYLRLMSKKNCCNVGFGVPPSINLPRLLWKGTCMGLVNSYNLNNHPQFYAILWIVLLYNRRGLFKHGKNACVIRFLFCAGVHFPEAPMQMICRQILLFFFFLSTMWFSLTALFSSRPTANRYFSQDMADTEPELKLEWIWGLHSSAIEKHEKSLNVL